MNETIIDTQSVQKIIARFIVTQKVKILEDNGIVTLIPVMEKKESPLRGCLGDGKLSSERFLEQKLLDKELERI